MSKYIDISGKKIDDTIETASNLIASALAARESDKLLERAKKSDQYFEGNQPARNRKAAMGNRVYNEYAIELENHLARMTEQRPKWEFKPQDEDDVDTAYILNKLVGDIIWDHIDWDVKAETSILDAMHTGSSHIKIGIDERGWPVVEPIKSESILVDGTATSKESLGYIVFLYEKRKEDVERRYGVKLSAVEERPEDFTTMKASDFISASSPNKITNVWALLDKSVRGKSYPSSNDQPKVTLAEIWMDDLSREPIPFDEQETDNEHQVLATGQDLKAAYSENHPKHIKEHKKFLELLDPEADIDFINIIRSHIEDHETYPQTLTRPKYPHGRIVTLSQGQLLRSEQFSLGRDWRNFVVKWDWSKLRTRYWGKSLGEDLFDRCDAYNHRKNSITANINLNSFGFRTIKHTLKKNLNGLTNLIGQNTYVNNHDDVKVNFGPSLPSHHFTDVAIEQAGIDRQAGLHSPLRGELPAPGTSGVSLDTLIKQGLVRAGLPAKHYLLALKEVAAAVIHLVVKFRPDGLRVNFKGQLISPKDIEDRVSMQDIRVSLKFNNSTRDADFNEAVGLYQARIYDRQAVLERLDDPNKDEIMKRQSEISQLTSALKQSIQQSDVLIKEINTMQNRSQNEEGQGNVGI